MKPDGRALDIAVVGLGQAGGNLAAEFYRRGYPALALNTAQTDLAALDPGGVFPSLPEDRRLYVGVDGYDGAGADPGYGRDCIRAHADRVRAVISKQATAADAVILCAGLGGGTGSAVAGLVEVLKDEQLPLLALLTLPTGSESGLAKVNAVRAINEVVDSPLLGWIFADNARISALNPDLSIVDYFAHINAEIVGPIDALNQLNSRTDLTPIRSFDGEDFRKLLLSGGVLNYAVNQLPDLEVDTIVGTVLQGIEDSDIMPSGFDVTRISYVGLVIEAPEDALERSSIQDFEAIAEDLKAQTGGAAIYHGLYRSAEANGITLRLLATTQSMPHRMTEILTDARREGQVLGEKVAEELPTLDLGEISDYSLFRTRSRPSDRQKRPSPSGAATRRPTDDLEDIQLEVGLGIERRRPEPTRPTLGRMEDSHRSGRPSLRASASDGARSRPVVRTAPKTPAARVALDLEPAAARPRRPRRRSPASEDQVPPASGSLESAATAPSPTPPPARAESLPAPAPDKKIEAPTLFPDDGLRNATAPLVTPSRPDRMDKLSAGDEPAEAALESAPKQQPQTSEPAEAAEEDQASGPTPRLSPDASADDRPRPWDAAPAHPSKQTKAPIPAQPTKPYPVGPAPSEMGTEQFDVSVVRSEIEGPTEQHGAERGAFLDRRAPVSTEGVAAADLPDPDMYDTLVARFLAAMDESERTYVAERLQTDAASEIPAVRYYAVDAMAKLASSNSRFREALTRAAQDEQEAIRQIASDALSRA